MSESPSRGFSNSADCRRVDRMGRGGKDLPGRGRRGLALRPRPRPRRPSPIDRVQLLLSLLAVVLAIAIQKSVPAFRPHPLLFYSAAAWGICQGLGSVWYFQGVEDLKVAAIVEVASKALGTTAVFLFVRRPEDAW